MNKKNINKHLSIPIHDYQLRKQRKPKQKSQVNEVVVNCENDNIFYVGLILSSVSSQEMRENKEDKA